ncbi:MAG: DUF3159 domain-containing protein [Rhodoglobus sp.]
MNEPEHTPTLSEAMAAAARRSGFGAVVPGDKPSGSALLAALGGIRGIVESIVPGFAFLVLYTITRSLVLATVVPLGISVLFVLVRIVSRTPFMSAVAGVFGLALSAGFALLTGEAKDNFVLGFVINSVFLVILAVSLMVRWPLVGVIASFITASGTEWRADPAIFRMAVLTTFLWCCLFGLRLGVQLPLYFAGNVDALAALKLILGLPLYAAVLWITWLLMRAVSVRTQSVQPQSD